MPLVRVEVRNEYGLGMPELYKEVNREDPKAVLDGVAVAGLVGILRQLGDLAEFAAEVFHGLQEQVLATSSRSHRLIVRLRDIEDALPPLEKAILAQRSHLHFAYTAGSHWHARFRSEQNHFIYGDLPRCIMDSYEESRDPPRLHVLDKFDPGGPGSCLKRYSDPTFFKKASAGSAGAHIPNARREKRTRQTKQKKRMWRRNKQEICDAPMSTNSGRMQSTSPDVSGQSFSSRDVSTFESATGSDRGNHSNSFDLRTGSNYIECVFRPSYSMQTEENEPKEVVTADEKRHRNDSLDSPSIEEQSGLIDADIQNSPSVEKFSPRPSCVTWDEKTEIVETTIQPIENTYMLYTLQQEGAQNFSVGDKLDFDFDDENMQVSVSGGAQPDDIDSETDYYMDALNTIESESETDLECQTKRELQHYSNLNKVEDMPTASPSDADSVNSEPHAPTCTSPEKVISEPSRNTISPENNVEDMPMTSPSDVHSVNSDTHALACRSPEKIVSEPSRKTISPETPVEDICFLNKETSEDKTNSATLDIDGYTQTPQVNCTSLIPGTSHKVLVAENGDVGDDSNLGAISGIESPSDSRESSSQALVSDKIVTTCESPKPPSASSGVHPVMFWTNGGLLGLEPSKPPDFGVPTAARQESLLQCNGDHDQASSRSNMLENNRDTVRAEMAGSSNFEQSSNLHHTNSDSYGHEHDSSFSTTSKPAIKGINNQVELESSMPDGKSPSQMFEFSNRLLLNGLRRQVSLVGDERLASSVRSDISEQTSRLKAHQTFTAKSFRESFGSEYTVPSSCSSPPLEHMKISFQPMDSFETSKLKLMLPDGSSCHETSGDMFPSFQLVPEPSLSLHDSGSDSDDDTFCRSSPCVSDDCRSHCSESDSEQWDYEDSPGSKNHEVNDGCMISSEQSASSSLLVGSKSARGFLDSSGHQNPFTNSSVELSLSGRLLDLPNFDSLDTTHSQEICNTGRTYFRESHFPKEPTTPSLPPLPPAQWRGVKPQPNDIEYRENALSGAMNALDLKLPASTISQQPKPAPAKHDNYVEMIEHTPKSKQQDSQKLNGHREADLLTNGKMADEKDDFLQQIRAKSFNLRRTTSALPTYTPGAPTNFKITAILEKANAIRQAVGSDDGTEDNWSDA